MERRIWKMLSALTWIDHDPATRERTLRILSLFQKRDSREELGLVAIRDSFADRLFPGTSTIQTRLRYMFFVPWPSCTKLLLKEDCLSQWCASEFKWRRKKQTFYTWFDRGKRGV